MKTEIKTYKTYGYRCPQCKYEYYSPLKLSEPPVHQCSQKSRKQYKMEELR